MDVLSSVMRELHLVSAAYCRLTLAAPWAIAFQQDGVRGIHIVTQGRCEISFEQGPTQTLETGDLVVAPRADPHVLRSVGGERVTAVSAAEVAAQAAGGRARVGEDGEQTVVVCGAFLFRDADHPALPGLPRVLRVPALEGQPPRWLRGYIEALLAEALDSGPGSEVVMARLTVALITRALRHGVDQADSAGWLRGLCDPGVAKALALVHDDCARRWTVASLARAVGLSRATFAARFHSLVGEPPMRYLFARRMREALTLLRDRRFSLAQIASATGYQSEAAFSAAFKRHVGLSPGEHRLRTLATQQRSDSSRT